MRRNVALACAVTVLFFVAVEAGLRLSGRIATNTLRSPDLRTLDSIPGVFEPSQEFVDRVRPDLPYHVRINSLGFRGAEFEARRLPGRTRILCLGDSYTFGHYVDDDEAWPAVLESLLRGAGHDVEVINGGVNGFTISDERRFLETKGLSLDPDGVVIVFSSNDLMDLERSRLMIDSMREHAGVKSIPILGPIVRVLQRTAIFNAMQKGAAAMRGRRRSDAAAVSPERLEALWEAYAGHLSAVSGMLTRRGIRGLLVAWPSGRRIEGTDPYDPADRLGRLASGLGLAFLDLTPSLSGLAGRGIAPTLAPLDGHPSPSAHATSARVIGEEARRLGWFGDSGGETS